MAKPDYEIIGWVDSNSGFLANGGYTSFIKTSAAGFAGVKNHATEQVGNHGLWHGKNHTVSWGQAWGHNFVGIAGKIYWLMDVSQFLVYAFVKQGYLVTIYYNFTRIDTGSITTTGIAIYNKSSLRDINNPVSTVNIPAFQNDDAFNGLSLINCTRVNKAATKLVFIGVDSSTTSGLTFGSVIRYNLGSIAGNLNWISAGTREADNSSTLNKFFVYFDDNEIEGLAVWDNGTITYRGLSWNSNNTTVIGANPYVDDVLLISETSTITKENLYNGYVRYTFTTNYTQTSKQGVFPTVIPTGTVVTVRDIRDDIYINNLYGFFGFIGTIGGGSSMMTFDADNINGAVISADRHGNMVYNYANSTDLVTIGSFPAVNFTQALKKGFIPESSAKQTAVAAVAGVPTYKILGVI